ncbi:MAG: hypothetical protein ACI8WA_000021 [Polaribacter sp.]|jgi:hypothetical protein
MIKTKIGELDVYEKGSLINPNKENIEISLGSKFQFLAEFKFTADIENKETRLEPYKLEKVGIGLNFVNFNNSLGTGNVNPIRVGWLEGRNLFFNYRVFGINNDKGVIFEYTWLLGKKVDADGNEI